MAFTGTRLCRALSRLRADLHLEVLAVGVLHGQPVDGGHVRLHAWWNAELQLLQHDGQEEKDLEAGNVFPNAPPLAEAKEDHLLTQCLVDSAIGGEKAFWSELRWVIPQFPVIRVSD